jgi:hypothetical protein
MERSEAHSGEAGPANFQFSIFNFQFQPRLPTADTLGIECTTNTKQETTQNGWKPD